MGDDASKRRLNNALQNHRRLHVTLGWGLLVGMLLFSATGLTWSQWAGGNVDKMRAAFGWLTPQVNTQLHGEMPMTHDPHAGHHMDAMAMAQHQPALQLAQFDQALAAARQAGLNASRLEIRLPVSDDRGWTVNEIDRRWPTQVDAVAIDGATMQVVDRTRFADFPLMAKLTRWGVDFHMGIPLWSGESAAAGGIWLRAVRYHRGGVPVMVDPPSASGGLGSGAFAAAGVAVARLACPKPGAWAGVCPGLAMPLMGASLLLFIAVDYPLARGNGNEDDEVQRLSEDLRRADDHRYPAVFGAPGRRVVAGDRVFFAKAAGD